MKPTQETPTLLERSWQGMKNRLPPSSLSSPWGLQEPCLQSPNWAQGSAGPQLGEQGCLHALHSQLQQVINLDPLGLPFPRVGLLCTPSRWPLDANQAQHRRHRCHHGTTASPNEGSAAQERAGVKEQPSLGGHPPGGAARAEILRTRWSGPSGSGPWPAGGQQLPTHGEPPPTVTDATRGTRPRR